MLKSILLGLDETAFSDAAIELGIQWAGHFDCLLVGLGVVNNALTQLPMVKPGSATYAAYEELVLAAQRRIEHRLESFSRRAGEAQVASKVLENLGYPTEEICREAQRFDLIMLGQQTHFHQDNNGRTDETLTHVLRTAPRPVVVVPEKLADGSGVLVAYDGSPQAARMLQAFVSLGLQTLGEVHVVSVDAESTGTAARIADRAVEFLRLHDIPAHAHPIHSLEPPGTVLLHEALRHGVALLAMGVYGQPRFKEIMVGSVTTTALRKCPLPMFLYH
ncbi:MAG: universal stress protein [Planctomycetes bacterium]|nr:universal stress protein [Planctomycetota bacterium]